MCTLPSRLFLLLRPLLSATMFSKIFFALAAVAASASALTVPRAADVVVTPAITSPTAGEIWPVGSTQKVTWDTTTVPAGSNITGVLLLGFVEDGSSDEHLDIGERGLITATTLNAF